MATIKGSEKELSVLHTSLQSKIGNLTEMIKDSRIDEGNKVKYREDLVIAQTLISDVEDNYGN